MVSFTAASDNQISFFKGICLTLLLPDKYCCSLTDGNWDNYLEMGLGGKCWNLQGSCKVPESQTGICCSEMPEHCMGTKTSPNRIDNSSLHWATVYLRTYLRQLLGNAKMNGLDKLQLSFSRLIVRTRSPLQNKVSMSEKHFVSGVSRNNHADKAQETWTLHPPQQRDLTGLGWVLDRAGLQ